MRVFFDTSALVAAFVASHPAHSACLKRLNHVRRGSDVYLLGGHSIAELYAVLTRLPVRPAVSPETARELIEQNTKDATISVLSAREYLGLLKHLEKQGLKGCVVYDAVLFYSARKARADVMITLNEKDFRRVAVSDELPRIEAP